jgi:hypothetical protein
MWCCTPLIPIAWEMEIKRMMVWGQCRQKVMETLSQPLRWLWDYKPVIPVLQEAKIEGSWSRLAWPKMWDFIWKIIEANRAEAQSSIPSRQIYSCEFRIGIGFKEVLWKYSVNLYGLYWNTTSNNQIDILTSELHGSFM